MPFMQINPLHMALWIAPLLWIAAGQRFNERVNGLGDFIEKASGA